MSADLLELAAYRSTAERPGCGPDDVGEAELRPVLLSQYRDLSSLRYDYPLILISGDAGDGLVWSLSGIVDGILQEIAPRGVAGERLRKQVLGLEQEMRALASRGARESLERLWDLAESNLLSAAADEHAHTSLGESLSRARRALRLDGEVIDCDGETPAKVLTHLWTAVEADKARNFVARLDRLILKLSDIIKADFLKSEAGRAPDNLKRSVGTSFEAAFDFEAMSRILASAAPSKLLPESRRQRIRATLSVLKSQRFFAQARERDEETGADGPDAHGFVFGSCAGALDAFRERLPETVEFIKAIAIAELEIENRYRDSIHGPFFSGFNEDALAADDLAPFPSYLICLRDGDCDAAEKSALIEILSSGLPVRVLVQSDDILEGLPIAAGRLAFGAKCSQLASMAVGLNIAYVLQSSASNLYRARDRILKGLAYDGPVLISVFSGSSGTAPGLPPYLAAAAAMESRAFPAFSYDPGAGDDWASRFYVEDNPQAETSWPVHSVLYEDKDHQSVCEDVAVTFADFVACDRRYAGRFATVSRSEWHEDMMPLGRYLERPDEDLHARVPYVLLVDRDDTLYRASVDDAVIDAARRSRQVWHNLQELGGINSSHAKRLLERERELWEQEKARELEALEGPLARETEAPFAVPDAVPSEAVPEAEAEVTEAPPSDEPYIETPRCTTCNECTEINNKMFVYDENMQAYIADPNAGTFQELVEAAESCQVCIIHPGKPRNPNEPNLAELIKRAESFM